MQLLRQTAALAASFSLLLAGCGGGTNVPGPATNSTLAIKHVVVIFDENISFDHYFGTYPNATNPSGEPAFTPADGTPTVNGLTGSLLTANPNSTNAANGDGATNPFRLDRSQAATADQDHDYTPEQMAFDNGAMDLFPVSVGTPNPSGSGPAATTGLTMGYFDGNTVTGLWNYAQNFAMSDNSYGTNYGPSTVGAINVISGQTNGAGATLNGTADEIDDGNGGLTVIGDPNPIGDVCTSPSSNQVQMTSPNIGDLLNAKGVTWGAFMGGFDLTASNTNGTTGCARSTTSAVTGVTETDYIPHHAWFQYYASTSNPGHTRPSSVSAIGTSSDGGANHQYDINDFYSAVAAGNLPAVNFLKAPGYQDGHAGYSDPLDEQAFIVNVVTTIEQSKFWGSTAIIIAYDDSDGWYDHAFEKPVNGSATSADVLNGTGVCGTSTTALPGVNSATTHAQGRCGYGPRLPLLVLSPWAKPNYVDHTLTDQSSITRFIEDTFLASTRIGFGSTDSIAGTINNMFNFSQPTSQNKNLPVLDPDTGEPQ
jgi:phospholipase C